MVLAPAFPSTSCLARNGASRFCTGPLNPQLDWCSTALPACRGELQSPASDSRRFPSRWSPVLSARGSCRDGASFGFGMVVEHNPSSKVGHPHRFSLLKRITLVSESGHKHVLQFRPWLSLERQAGHSMETFLTSRSFKLPTNLPHSCD